MDNDGTFPLIWDSGASMCLTSHKSDFVGEIEPWENSVQGISSGLQIKGKGNVCWTLLDVDGKFRRLELPAFYAPEARTRLLSTSVFCAKYPLNTISMTAHRWTVNPYPRVKDERPIDIYINPLNNLPQTTCFKEREVNKTAVNFSEMVTTTHKDNHNLPEPHKELIRWHNRLGHIGMRTIQFLLKQGVLAKSQQMRQLHSRIKNIPSHNLPKCAACQFGRQTNRAVPGKTTTVNRARKGITSADRLHPGDLVFIDHFTCSTRGRKNEGAGLTRGAARRSNDHSYKGGCIFVDAGTGYISIKFQSYLTAEETINAVSAYEREAYDHGIIIKSYQSDNGSQFTSKAFKEHIARNRQSNRYASAGSHHQNGKAERAIRTIMAMARTMLLHSSIHWPEMSEPTLWPQAVKHAVWIYNHVPSPENGLMSVDLWTKTRYPIQKLHNLHVFGCPVYVLEKNLADGKSLGRWKARSNRCLYLGLSMQHSAEAALVLNPNTGQITPQ